MKGELEPTEPTYTLAKDAVPTWRPRRENCTPPAIEQFPRPLMGKWLRRHGGLIIHILVAVFTFFGLAIVCDEYFVASLDRLCEGRLRTSFTISIFCAWNIKACNRYFIILSIIRNYRVIKDV